MEVINTGSGEGLGMRLLGPDKVFLVTYIYLIASLSLSSWFWGVARDVVLYMVGSWGMKQVFTTEISQNWCHLIRSYQNGCKAANKKIIFSCILETYSCPKSLPEVTQVYLPCFNFEAEWVEPLGFNSARGWFLVFEGTCLSLFVGEMVGSSAELRPYLCAFTSWGVCGERRGGLGYAHGTTETEPHR